MEDLEAAVRATWDREAIAVYGDHLQAIGDPRGELVAIDLRIDEAGALPELVARRTELIAAWFGDDLPPGSVRYGFVDVDATSARGAAQLEAALSGPGSRYVRSVAVVGPPEQLVRAAQLLVGQPHPWLTSLVMRQWRELPAPTLGLAACALIVAATPNLRELELEGRRVLADLAHPAVQRARISGYDAIASLVGDGPPFARLASLDLALQCHFADEHADPSPVAQRALLAVERFPALRELDLSRNEPGRLAPHTLGGSVDVFELVRTRAVRRQLEILHVPSPRTDGHQASLRSALADMRELRELVVHGRAMGELEHPRAAIRYVERPSIA